ncbi:hypothetical protein [Phaeospirillum tilakii]|uniref:Uncharacterized protein n=1 Tax=Phaeospirillum tilakii TaxID=741673 RepID=A0ABW5C7N1_9PROT
MTVDPPQWQRPPPAGSVWTPAGAICFIMLNAMIEINPASLVGLARLGGGSRLGGIKADDDGNIAAAPGSKQGDE